MFVKVNTAYGWGRRFGSKVGAGRQKPRKALAGAMNWGIRGELELYGRNEQLSRCGLAISYGFEGSIQEVKLWSF